MVGYLLVTGVTAHEGPFGDLDTTLDGDIRVVTFRDNLLARANSIDGR